VKIGFKFQSLGKISNITAADPHQFFSRSIPTLDNTATAKRKRRRVTLLCVFLAQAKYGLFLTIAVPAPANFAACIVRLRLEICFVGRKFPHLLWLCLGLSALVEMFFLLFPAQRLSNSILQFINTLLFPA